MNDEQLQQLAIDSLSAEWRVQVSKSDRFPYLVIEKDEKVVAFAYHWLWPFSSAGIQGVTVPVEIWVHLRNIAEKTQISFMVLSQHYDKKTGHHTLLWKKFPPATGMGYPIRYDEGLQYPFLLIPHGEFKIITLDP